MTAPDVLRRIFISAALFPGLALVAQNAAPVKPAAAPTAAKTTPASGQPEEDEASIRMAALEVEGDRVKPFSSASMDLPRTVNDPQAYLIFDARTIERSGAPSLENFIRERLPMASGATTQDQSVFVGGTGSNINLRGFGSAQTLILINGRQAPMANLQLNGFNPQPDINGVPLGAVDRIEVLPSSASGIYGGGAVGGVINIILKRNYSGGEVRLNYQNPVDGDAPIRRVDLSYGFSLEKGRTQALFSASWSDRDLLTYGDRLDPLDKYETGSYLNDVGNPSPSTALGSTPNIRSSTNVPLTLKAGGSLNSPITYIPFGTTASTPAATLAAGLLANAGRYNTERPDTVQNHGGLRGTIGTAPKVESFIANVRREFTPNLDVYTEFNYSGTKNWRNLNSNLGVGAIPATSPNNPFMQAVTVVLPITGDYPVSSNNLTRRITVGAIAKLPRDWIVDLDYTWTRSNNSFKSTGFLTAADISTAVAAGAINPFVDTKLSPINLDSYNSTVQFSGAGSKNLISLRAVGPILKLPAGETQLAVGLEQRGDGLTGGYHTTEYINFPTRNIIRYAIGKRQTIKSAYAELRMPLIAPEQNVPFARLVDLQLTGRFEDFRVNAFTTFIQLLPVLTPPPRILESKARYESANPTIAMRWQPVRGVMLRGSLSRGFAPPTFDQLLGNPDPSTALAPIQDPRRGGASYGVTTLAGGNAGLEPEASRSESAGIILSPTFLKGFRFSADWMHIEKTNNITTLQAQQMVDNEAIFPGRVTRGPVPAGDTFTVGPITLLDLSSLNILHSFVEAIDYSVGYRGSTDRFGTFDVSALATITSHYKRQLAFGQPFVEAVNYSTVGPLKRQGYATVTWDYQRWAAGWTARYVGPYRLSAPPVTPSTIALVRQGGPIVASQVFHEVFASYRFPRANQSDGISGWRSFFRGVEIQIGVRNLLDFMPRYDASNITYYYSTWGDIRGREYRVTLKKAF